jgi:exocyst complex protein 7
MINKYIASSSSSRTGQGGQEASTVRLFADSRGRYISQSLSTSAAATLSTARKTNPDAIYQRGNCGIGAYAKALEGMLSAELINIQAVFPRDEWGRVMLATAKPALNEFEKTLGDLNNHIRANLMTDAFLGFEVMELVSQLSSRLTSQAAELKKPLVDALQPIRTTAKSSLPKMLEDTRSRVQALASLSPEGGATQITVDIMSRLQALTSYLGPVVSLLGSFPEGIVNPSSPVASTAPSISSFDVDMSMSSVDTQFFARYGGDTLENLVSALDSRGRLLLKSQGVQAVFMCNNVAIIEGMIRASDLASLLVTVQPRIDTWKSKHVKLYLNAWTPATSQLLDVQYTNRASRPTSGGHTDSASVVKGMGTKEKDNIKEKFRAFNTTFDDLVSKHRGYKMEKEVRSLLAREVQRVIEPLYGRFWDRYHEVDKGKGKYVRYDKQSLAAMFAGL